MTVPRNDEKELKEACGRRLQAARRALGFTARDHFARVLGEKGGQLGNWEAGYNFPKARFLIRLAERYGIPESYVLRGTLVGMPEDIRRVIEEEEGRRAFRSRRA